MLNAGRPSLDRAFVAQAVQSLLRSHVQAGFTTTRLQLQARCHDALERGMASVRRAEGAARLEMLGNATDASMEQLRVRAVVGMASLARLAAHCAIPLSPRALALGWLPCGLQRTLRRLCSIRDMRAETAAAASKCVFVVLGTTSDAVLVRALAPPSPSVRIYVAVRTDARVRAPASDG